MKAKALQFGKAMSAALFVLLLVVVGMKNALAQTQVATLQHGDDVSAFYGGNAFVEAHTAAQAGDIITLSSGTFTPCDITKAITLRGAGCAVDTVAGTNPTIFGVDFTLNVIDSANYLTIEGILFSCKVTYETLYNPQFNRCSFVALKYPNSNSVMHNAQFLNCIINEFSFLNARNTVLINSVVCLPSNTSYNIGSRVTLYNSIIKLVGSTTKEAISAYNSIIIRTEYLYRPNSTCTFVNCIGIVAYNAIENSGPFGAGNTVGCTTYNSYEEVFESFSGVFSMDESFTLKDEVVTGFLGSDGTQVGIYGGPLPYSSRPGYMVLKRCNVAGRSTIDGKLSVDIEVVTEE